MMKWNRLSSLAVYGKLAYCRRTKRTMVTNMDDIVNICKRRGFVFQSNEIYSALSGFYDYGHLGVELKNNIKELWWKDFVKCRDDIVGIDTAIISPSKLWEASGHIQGFSDPMVECKVTNQRFRADQVFWGPVIADDGSERILDYVTVLETSDSQHRADQQAKKLARACGYTGKIKAVRLVDLLQATEVELEQHIPSPTTGQKAGLSRPRNFNLMFGTKVGAVADESTTAYLRPETAQGIFANFGNIQRTARMKIPFGIAQIGKAFRNEITPRNFLFRSREFEQMEIEYFIEPGEEIWKEYHERWVNEYMNWLSKLGIPREMLEIKVHDKDNLAHYAKACSDILFKYPFGLQELMGIAARGNFDLSQHAKHSGKNLEYFDPNYSKSYLPHVIEPSIGLDRLVLALLVSAYTVEPLEKETRTVLKLHPAITPIKACVLPLLSNNPYLVERSQLIYSKIKRSFTCEFDQSGAIGKRYRRADEIGTMFCITIDHQTLVDSTVTIRDRDTMNQQRIKEADIDNFLNHYLSN